MGGTLLSTHVWSRRRHEAQREVLNRAIQAYGRANALPTPVRALPAPAAAEPAAQEPLDTPAPVPVSQP